MKTVTIDIIDVKVMSRLKTLEEMGFIRIHNSESTSVSEGMADLKGTMDKQPIEEVNKQLNGFRKG